MASLWADTTHGNAPLVVTFTMNATDPDSNPLTWTFDANNDTVYEATGTGSELPKTVTWAYATPGQYTAVFRVSDGTDEAVEALLVLVS